MCDDFVWLYILVHINVIFFLSLCACVYVCFFVVVFLSIRSITSSFSFIYFSKRYDQYRLPVYLDIEHFLVW